MSDTAARIAELRAQMSRARKLGLAEESPAATEFYARQVRAAQRQINDLEDGLESSEPMEEHSVEPPTLADDEEAAYEAELARRAAMGNRRAQRALRLRRQLAEMRAEIARRRAEREELFRRMDAEAALDAFEEGLAGGNG